LNRASVASQAVLEPYGAATYLYPLHLDTTGWARGLSGEPDGSRGLGDLSPSGENPNALILMGGWHGLGPMPNQSKVRPRVW